MKHLRRIIGLAVTAVALFAVLALNAAIVSYAQTTNTVSIDGSKIVSPILQAAVKAYTAKNPDTKIDVNVSGTSGGFEKLCNGALDINMAAQAISDAEVAACQGKKLNFIELLLGYDALVVVVNNSSTVQCLTSDQLNKLLSPSATGLKDWLAVDPALGNAPINGVYAPPPDSQVYVLADSIVPGDKLRSDIQQVDNGTKVGEKVTADTNGVGIMTLSDYNSVKAAQPNWAIRGLQMKTGNTCVDANVGNLEEARYPAAESLYLYVNAASLDRKPVSDFLNYLFSSEGRAPVTNVGFIAGSDTTYDRDLNYLKNKQTGRTFSRIQNVTVPPDTAGSVATDGSAAVFPVLKAIGDAFSPRFQNIKLNTAAYGDEAGYRSLCAGTVDVIGASRLPTDAEAGACQKANIQTLRLQLGSQGVVVVVNGNNKFAQCLTTDQIGKIFDSASDGKVKKWSDVSANFPATDLLILTPNDGAPETDLLLSKTVKAVAPIPRKDVTQNSDPLYRAAATQNVEGAVTYMTFAEFQNVKSNVHAVSVNAGNNCVDPTEANLKNGAYPISRTLYVVLNVKSLNKPELKAFVWYLLSDDALAVISKQGLVGTDIAGFIAARDVALERFAQASTTPSGTPGASAGATAVATLPVTAPATTSAATATTAATITAPTFAVTSASTPVAIPSAAATAAAPANTSTR